MQSDRELDRIIEAALPGYSLAEPRPGLEQRILARAQTQRPSRRGSVFLWLAAIPAIACLVIVFLPVPNKPHPIEAPVAVNNPAPKASMSMDTPPLSPGFQLGSGSAQHPRRPNPGTSPLPKLNVFPSQAPLTAEEQAMIALSRASVPIPNRPEFTEVKIAPIHIAELQIEPVTVPPLDPLESTQPNQRNKQP